MAINTFVEFSLPEAQALADYTGTAYDLNSARDFAKLALSEAKPELREALTIATIIQYARAFPTGVRLNLYKEGVSTLTNDQRLKHDSIIHIRNKHIAHSVNAFEESQPIARFWVERVGTEGIETIECIHRRVVGLNHHDLTDLVNLASIWLEYVERRLKEEKVRLLPIVRQFPLDRLLASTPAAMSLDTSRPDKRR